jgi:hypothetical protein
MHRGLPEPTGKIPRRGTHGKPKMGGETREMMCIGLGSILEKTWNNYAEDYASITKFFENKSCSYGPKYQL